MAAIQINIAARVWVTITGGLRGGPKWKLIKIGAAHCNGPPPLLLPILIFIVGQLGSPGTAPSLSSLLSGHSAFIAKLHSNEVCYS